MKFLKKKLTVAVVVLSVTFLILIGYTYTKPNNLKIRDSIGNGLTYVQKAVYKICSDVKNSIFYISNFSEVKQQNKDLLKENTKLKQKISENSNLEDENERLRKILDYKKNNSEYDYKSCNIIGKGGENYLDGFIIDKGKKDGIRKKMAVVNSFGLVGQITYVADNFSLLQTIENENIKIGGYVSQTKENTGIVQGYKGKEGKISAKIEYLPLESKIKTGDEIRTGLVNVNKEVEPGIYPKGIAIGKVTKVEVNKSKMMKSALIKPYVDFDKLEELFIMVPKNSRYIN